MNMEDQNKNNYLIPASIIIAGAFIAGAMYFSDNANMAENKESAQAEKQQEQPASLDNVAPITGKDHVLGNPDAPIKIVEYSDFECPFCKVFHTTMQQVMDEYGKNGKVAWVYRHFPLDSIHSNARPEAVASECAAELGGNAAFWEFADRFFAQTPSNNRTDLSMLPQIAKTIEIDTVEFQTCLTSDRHDAKIQSDLENGVATGGRGTPWSVVITPSGQKFSINGAQPYDVVKQLIELGLSE